MKGRSQNKRKFNKKSNRDGKGREKFNAGVPLPRGIGKNRFPIKTITVAFAQ